MVKNLSRYFTEEKCIFVFIGKMFYVGCPGGPEVKGEDIN